MRDTLFIEEESRLTFQILDSYTQVFTVSLPLL